LAPGRRDDLLGKIEPAGGSLSMAGAMLTVSRVDICQGDSGRRYKHRYQKRPAHRFVMISHATHDATGAFEVTGFIAPHSRRADTVL